MAVKKSFTQIGAELKAKSKAEKAAIMAPTAKKEPLAFKPPKTLGECADLLYTTKNERLAQQKMADALEKKENALKDYIIETLPKSKANGVAGHLARVTLEKKDIPRAEDWSKIYAQVVKNYLAEVKKKSGQEDGAFALLNRALNATAVGDVWATQKEVPGVLKFVAIKVSINKL
jgi:hypothetical protein